MGPIMAGNRDADGLSSSGAGPALVSYGLVFGYEQAARRAVMVFLQALPQERRLVRALLAAGVE